MIYANIASIPDRSKELLNTIETIYDQVDEINLYLNNYKESPIKDKKVNVEFGDNSKGDAGKFYFAELVDGYYFTMDDDLLYPETYIKDMIDKYNRGIVTQHGRSFNSFPVRSYYKSANTRCHCLHTVREDTNVQFGGTGVMMFHTEVLKPSFEYFIHPNMADVFIGILAHQKGVQIKCLAHQTGYIKNQLDAGRYNIFASHHNRDSIQTNLVNNYFK